MTFTFADQTICEICGKSGSNEKRGVSLYIPLYQQVSAFYISAYPRELIKIRPAESTNNVFVLSDIFDGKYMQRN